MTNDTPTTPRDAFTGLTSQQMIKRDQQAQDEAFTWQLMGNGLALGLGLVVVVMSWNASMAVSMAIQKKPCWVHGVKDRC